MMHNAIFKNLTGLEADAPVAIKTSIMSLPALPTELQLDISTILGGVLYPYATSFLLPVSIYSLSPSSQSLPSFFPPPPPPPPPPLSLTFSPPHRCIWLH